jgi:hypothetical protein
MRAGKSKARHPSHSNQEGIAMSHRIRAAACTAFACAFLALLAVQGASAMAVQNACPPHSVYQACQAGWEITSHMEPTNVAPGHRAQIELYVFNVGAASTEVEKPFTVTDILPEGVTALAAGAGNGGSEWNCSITGGSIVHCANNPEALPTWLGGGVGVNIGTQKATPLLKIEVEASGPERTATNTATVTGGGASDAASTTSPLVVSGAPPAFGIANWDAWFSNADGTLDTLAGSHPYTATFDLQVNSQVSPDFQEIYEGSEPLSQGYFQAAGGELRDATVDLPPGFVGNPTAVPQCPRAEFDTGPELLSTCPPDTVIGFASAITGAVGTEPYPIFNLVPPPGIAAQFGFNETGNPVFLDSGVKVGSDDHIVTRALDNPQGRAATGAVITLWGVPGDPSHDATRCNETGFGLKPCASGAGTAPLLTLPTACGTPPTATAHVSTWQAPVKTATKAVAFHDTNGVPVSFTGCERLNFNPRITTDPDTSYADTPAGLTVEVTPSVGGLTQPTGLSTADIQNTTVTLPPGFVINPGQAAGLQACRAGTGEGSDELPLPGEDGGEDRFDGPARCPNSSKVGTVTIKSPLIEGGSEKQFEGSIYVLQSNPPEVKLLAAASANGVNLKLVGAVHMNEQTGQLTTTFAGTPELPFTNFKLSFSGGAQAALDTPTHCGIYTAASDFTPWSSPYLTDAFPSGEFAISAGPGDGPCPSDPLPFAPTMIAGSTTDQAGAFTNFSLLLQRGDGQQRIEKLQFEEPVGLAGLISSVPLCDEADANAGTCPEASHIGHAVVASGPGPYPLVLPQPGAPELPIYLTGPYKGAPFGLSIVTPVIAGPFDLGTIVTRASIAVDPTTAQITITTDPLPQIVDGVPTDLRSINSIIDRPNFLFNPTNCTPAQFTGTATSAGGAASAPLSSHFGVGSCRSLEFHPKVAVTTAAKSSKTGGASLFFKISYPKGALGKEAWFDEAKFDLPKQLPARLTTIQKACLAATFEANPAACPSGSLIGHAIVHTPVLPVPLAGPVYFVSHGGAKFPDAVIVLQGDGVKVDLTGETFIDGKTGITSATFRNTPDVPFENIEVTVPAGPFSEFAANLPAKAKDSFCGQKLVMPTLFKAQNGLEINQNTTVGVTGCAKTKTLSRKQKLAAALRACKKKAKGKRMACERAAKRKFGSVQKKRK